MQACTTQEIQIVWFWFPLESSVCFAKALGIHKDKILCQTACCLCKTVKRTASKTAVLPVQAPFYKAITWIRLFLGFKCLIFQFVSYEINIFSYRGFFSVQFCGTGLKSYDFLTKIRDDELWMLLENGLCFRSSRNRNFPIQKEKSAPSKRFLEDICTYLCAVVVCVSFFLLFSLRQNSCTQKKEQVQQETLSCLFADTSAKPMSWEQSPGNWSERILCGPKSKMFAIGSLVTSLQNTHNCVWVHQS